jgi:hypothetical protein
MAAGADREIHLFTARIPKAEFEALRSYASLARCSVNDVVQRALREFLRAHSGGPEIELMLDDARQQFLTIIENMPEE